MVHIIGVDHIIQHDGWIEPKKETAIREFQRYLHNQVRLTGATMIAEEFSEDAITLSHASMSTVAEVAAELGLRHLFFDPGRAERLRRGISTAIQRECYWLEQLSPFRAEEIIFVCGDSHVTSFSSILAQNEWEHEILSEGWGRNLDLSREDAS